MIPVLTIFALLPYVGPGIRFPAGVQPWAAAIAAVALVTTIALRPQKAQRLFRRSDLALIALAIWFAIYIAPDAELGVSDYVRKNAVFLGSLPIMIVARELSPNLLRRVLSLAVRLYVVVALVQYVSTDLYVRLVGPFVELKDVVIGERGAASLAPEATDFGFTMVYLFVFLVLLRFEGGWNERQSRQISIDLALAIFGIVLSQSASGVFALTAVGGIWLLRRLSPERIAVGSVAVVAFVYVVGFYPPAGQIRGVQVMREAVADPASLFATTASYRIVHNVVGLRGLQTSYGVGHGGGAFPEIAVDLYRTDNLSNRFELAQWYRMEVPVTLRETALGVFPQLLLEYGIPGLLFAYLIARSTWRSRHPLRSGVMVLLALTWLQSFPTAYPPFWLLVGFCEGYRRRSAAAPADDAAERPEPAADRAEPALVA